MDSFSFCHKIIKQLIQQGYPAGTLYNPHFNLTSYIYVYLYIYTCINSKKTNIKIKINTQDSWGLSICLNIIRNEKKILYPRDFLEREALVGLIHIHRACTYYRNLQSRNRNYFLFINLLILGKRSIEERLTCHKDRFQLFCDTNNHVLCQKRLPLFLSLSLPHSISSLFCFHGTLVF